MHYEATLHGLGIFRATMISYFSTVNNQALKREENCSGEVCIHALSSPSFP